MSQTVKVERWAKTHQIGVDEVIDTLGKLGVKNVTKKSTIPSKILPLLEVEFGSPILAAKTPDPEPPHQIKDALEQIQEQVEKAAATQQIEQGPTITVTPPPVQQTIVHNVFEKTPVTEETEDPFSNLLEEIEPLLNEDQKTRLGAMILALSVAAGTKIDESQNQILTKSVPASSGTMSQEEVQEMAAANEQIPVLPDPSQQPISLFQQLMLMIMIKRRKAAYGL